MGDLLGEEGTGVGRMEGDNMEDYWQRWSVLARRIALDPEERLVLRMVYQDGIKVAGVARAMNRPEHQVRRMLKATLARLREQLEDAGLSAAELQALSANEKTTYAN